MTIRTWALWRAVAGGSLWALLAAAVVARGDDGAANGAVSPEREAPLVLPLLGLGFAWADPGGGGLRGEVGLRAGAFLARGSVELAGGSGAPVDRTYVAAALHLDGVLGLGPVFAAVAGLGFGAMRYGYLFDGPGGETPFFQPELGVLVGHERRWGRILVTVGGLLPTASAAWRADRGIEPPRVVFAAVLSL